VELSRSIGTAEHQTPVGIGGHILRLESRPKPFVEQLRRQMHAGQGKAISVDGLDMNALGQTGRKTAAIVTDAGELNPIGLDFD
jgi:hypothetical protein